ncbi:hypothetical protein ATR1_075d0009 [Acetobacter tropicalis]|uniref:Uncharacterized protein n=1 Tax=Acetobacter tropicalis TaxID=104102 RepID=A0A511FK30_9PROT|nr:hypothetical protein ATR1_075d0009 [Acetobacter tropicalis]GEL48934.1 hypothetical protein ATR01nite_00090 [Acetobacter tropicalis]
MVAIVLVRRFCNRREPVTVTFSVFDSVPALESEACFITFDATESWSVEVAWLCVADAAGVTVADVVVEAAVAG